MQSQREHPLRCDDVMCDAFDSATLTIIAYGTIGMMRDEAPAMLPPV